MAGVVAFGTVSLQVRGDRGLQRRQEHAAGTLPSDLVETTCPIAPASIANTAPETVGSPTRSVALRGSLTAAPI